MHAITKETIIEVNDTFFWIFNINKYKNNPIGIRNQEVAATNPAKDATALPPLKLKKLG